MIILSSQDLNNYGAVEASSTLALMGKVFVKRQSFSLEMREQAIQLAEQSLQKGRPCLLVDGDTDTTLWVEVQNHVPLTNAKDASLSPSPAEETQSSGLTYRGQAIAEPGPSNSTPRSLPTDNKPKTAKMHKMQYRGNSF